jgi:hypothetical protein
LRLRLGKKTEEEEEKEEEDDEKQKPPGVRYRPGAILTLTPQTLTA